MRTKKGAKKGAKKERAGIGLDFDGGGSGNPQGAGKSSNRAEADNRAPSCPVSRLRRSVRGRCADFVAPAMTPFPPVSTDRPGRPAATPYEDLMRHVAAHGVAKADRTGTGTKSVFGHQMRFDLAAGFPLVTTKKVHFRSVALELLWFLRGDGNARWLQERGVTIWDEWAAPDGSLGPVYGVQWRSWPAPDGRHIDQIAQALHTLRTDPDSRRIVVSAWNVADLPKMALAPCHALFQFHVAPAAGDGARPKLSCQLYQRSADIFLGVPFNLASYALLTHMVAQQCDFDVGDFVWTGGDCHLYDNHAGQVALQLAREPFAPPRLLLRRQPPSIYAYDLDAFEIVDYRHHPAIKAPVAV